MSKEEALAAEARSFFGSHLRLSQPDDRVSVMGAGAGDDALEEGRAFLALMAEGGWATPTWPEQYGGRGATAAEAAVIARELAPFETPDLYPFGVGLSLVGPTVIAHGSEEQKARWLPSIRDGSEIWCQLFSEPDAGSDLAALTATATRDGDTWVVSGSKVWSSRAHYARWGLLLARTDWDVPKHAGITAFALDMTASGVEVRPLKQMNGDEHFNQVFLDDVAIPDGDRIGEPGGGWGVSVTTLMHERTALGGGGGLSRGQALELFRRGGAGADPVLRQRAAAVIAAMEAGRMTGLRARAAAKEGRPPGPEGSGGKLRISKTFKALADLAADLKGPAAVAGDLDDEWTTFFLTAPSLSIRGGTDEIQRNILGERVLGLPPEPRPDKGVPFSEIPRSTLR